MFRFEIKEKQVDCFVLNVSLFICPSTQITACDLQNSKTNKLYKKSGDK